MNDDQSLIASVIVLPYNDKQYLDACLSSPLDQKMLVENYDVIYANNASTDGSADFVADRFPNVRVLRFNENHVDGDKVPTLFIAGGSLLIDPEIHDQLKYYFDPTYFIYNEDTDLGSRINNLNRFRVASPG